MSEVVRDHSDRLPYVGRKNSIPRDPITERQMMRIGVYHHLRNARYLRFHETILSFGEPGSLGNFMPET